MPSHLSGQPRFVWAHDVYYKDGPDVKNIEIRINDEHNGGKVVHREIHKGVYCENATTLAEKVLANYLSLHQNDADAPSQRQVPADPDWDF